MTKRESKAEGIDRKGLLPGGPADLRTMAGAIVQAALGAEKGERTAACPGCRGGCYGRPRGSRGLEPPVSEGLRIVRGGSRPGLSEPLSAV
jgi:hypothetical protein